MVINSCGLQSHTAAELACSGGTSVSFLHIYSTRYQYNSCRTVDGGILLYVVARQRQRTGGVFIGQ